MLLLKEKLGMVMQRKTGFFHAGLPRTLGVLWGALSHQQQVIGCSLCQTCFVDGSGEKSG